MLAVLSVLSTMTESSLNLIFFLSSNIHQDMFSFYLQSNDYQHETCSWNYCPPHCHTNSFSSSLAVGLVTTGLGFTRGSRLS